MDKVFVVKRVAEQLWATEEAIDDALARASGLMGGMIEARQELKVSALFGDAPTTKVAEAVKALADARHAMMEAHDALAEAKLRLGVRTRMDGVPKPIQNVETDAGDRRAV